MAGTVKTKAQIYSDIAALPNPITPASLKAVMDDIVASYENLIQEYTTVQRNALTPFEGQKIYNTTSNRLEYYSASAWLPCSQKETVAVDCSANPNYQEGLVGDQYIVSVAGKIGGGSGKSVYVGDMVYCIAANAGGNEATVGTNWAVCYSTGATDSPTRYLEVSLDATQILALNTTPQTLVPAPGAGKIIVGLTYVVQFIWNSIAYATNTTMQAKFDTGVGVSLFNINGTASAIATGAQNPAPIANKALQLTVATGDPTAGNSTMKVGVYYKIHTL